MDKRNRNEQERAPVERAEGGGAPARLDYEEVARRAHERFQERGGGHGDDQADWFDAEREVQERSSAGQEGTNSGGGAGNTQKRRE